MRLKWSFRFVFNSFKVFPTTQSLRWNHYKSLGLKPSASAADVKAAYYKLSKLHHPDRNNGSEASAKKFRDIVAAYEVLSKADSRRKYDREIVKKYEARISDLGLRKKGNKRNKKGSSSSKVKSNNFKRENYSWNRSKSGAATKGMHRYEKEDFEAFIVRAIPLVVACLLCCKKR